ncbi:hypothetical protein Aduo_009209 [Ancylostoma duodenale]
MSEFTEEQLLGTSPPRDDYMEQDSEHDGSNVSTDPKVSNEMILNACDQIGEGGQDPVESGIEEGVIEILKVQELTKKITMLGHSGSQADVESHGGHPSVDDLQAWDAHVLLAVAQQKLRKDKVSGHMYVARK